jgi:hypothetical protein
MNPVIDVAIEAEDWASLEAPSQLAEAAILAGSGKRRRAGANAEISVLLRRRFIRDLNRNGGSINRPMFFFSSREQCGCAAPQRYRYRVRDCSREASMRKVVARHVAHLLCMAFASDRPRP